MAILKAKEISEMKKEEINNKKEELKTELIKARINAHKSGKMKIKEIKRTIARLITFSKIKQLKNK